MSEPRWWYVAYLRCLWQVTDEGQVGWQASLENAHSGKRQALPAWTICLPS